MVPGWVKRSSSSSMPAGGDALALARQTEQQVLGADVVVREPAGLPLGIGDRVLGTLGHAHRPTSSLQGRPPGPKTGIIVTGR
jgi:hypothetical protein